MVQLWAKFTSSEAPQGVMRNYISTPKRWQNIKAKPRLTIEPVVLGDVSPEVVVVMRGSQGPCERGVFAQEVGCRSRVEVLICTGAQGLLESVYRMLGHLHPRGGTAWCQNAVL